MVLNIVTVQIKETRFLSQFSRSYLSNSDGEPLQNNKDGCKVLIITMAALFGKNLLSQNSILLRKPCVEPK